MCPAGAEAQGPVLALARTFAVDEALDAAAMAASGVLPRYMGFWFGTFPLILTVLYGDCNGGGYYKGPSLDFVGASDDNSSDVTRRVLQLSTGR